MPQIQFPDFMAVTFRLVTISRPAGDRVGWVNHPPYQAAVARPLRLPA